jgi:hypothetical protein
VQVGTRWFEQEVLLSLMLEKNDILLCKSVELSLILQGREGQGIKYEKQRNETTAFNYCSINQIWVVIN